jgi:hypothetical protein
VIINRAPKLLLVDNVGYVSKSCDIKGAKHISFFVNFVWQNQRETKSSDYKPIEGKPTVIDYFLSVTGELFPTKGLLALAPAIGRTEYRRIMRFIPTNKRVLHFLCLCALQGGEHKKK